MSIFQLRRTSLEDHSLLNEDQVMVKKSLRYASRGLPRVRSCQCWTIATMLAALWLYLWVYYFRDVGNVSHQLQVTTPRLRFHVTTHRPKPSRAAGPGVVSRNIEAHLVVLPQGLADETGAYCLDGSPPAYYFRNATSEEHHNSWIIHLMKGAWCYDNAECARRSATALGSSRKLRPKKLFGGILSSSFTVNPDFYDWNVAVVNYCDGASFSGDREDPVISNKKKMYYRGSRVLNAVINYLLKSAGLQRADRVILSGDSAGGLAVLLHADRVSRMVPKNTSFKAMADGGFFLANEADTSGKTQWKSAMENVYQMQQIEGGLDKDCLLAKEKNKSECFFAQHTYPYLTTPVFVVNSVYDSWTLKNILGVRCRPSKCNEKDLGVIEKHRRTFLQRMDQVNRYDKNGMFLTSCYAHLLTCVDSPWMTYKVAGRTAREAFADWYYERTTPAETRDVDCDSNLTCNPTCRSN
ncbi:pectin acetylesterase 11-like isoform X2 [Patiria miniata]|uniref:Pectin acetylesterase n=1 Tax=Patiria miniata TaxID=46514 RepID=A0A913ZMM8_PATMI|nr:pectin acetylesterase 11-like isoform X2 [Patiria miniata]